MIFNAYNTSTSIGSWSEFSDGRPVYCTPHTTVEMNLHTEAPVFADRVASVYFVAHAREVSELPLSFLVSGSWTTGLSELPSGAKANGEPRLRLTSNRTFALRQNLTLDDWRCGARGAILQLRAQLRGDDTWSVIVTETYVDTGWGDAWGCRTRMQNALSDGAISAARKLQDGLNAISLGDGPRHYLVPQWGLREFNLYSGGKPMEWPVLRTF